MNPLDYNEAQSYIDEIAFMHEQPTSVAKATSDFTRLISLYAQQMNDEQIRRLVGLILRKPYASMVSTWLLFLQMVPNIPLDVLLRIESQTAGRLHADYPYADIPAIDDTYPFACFQLARLYRELYKNPKFLIHKAQGTEVSEFPTDWLSEILG